LAGVDRPPPHSPDPVLLCAPEQKAELEARNAVDQLDYIAELANVYQVQDVRESHIQQLHELAIKDIYPCGGRYRNAIMHVKIGCLRTPIPPRRFPPLSRGPKASRSLYTT
jgi:hypothetical protein